MDHTLFKEELKAAIADFNKEIQVPTCCFEFRFDDPASVIAQIAALVYGGYALEGALEPRLCERCGAWHARRIKRNGTNRR